MRLLTALLLMSAASVASAQGVERVPRIGLAGDDLDACLSVGQVTGLDPRGDNYLTVRANPAASGREKDRLGPGRLIWLCDEAGDWLGVVYGDGRSDGPDDCGVGTPATHPQPYGGPCRTGWVHSRYVAVIAG